MNSNWLGLKSDSINVRYFSKKLFSNGTNTLVYPKIDLTTLWGLVGSWCLKLFSILLWCAPIYQFKRKDKNILVRQRFQFYWSNKQPTIDIISIEDDDLRKFINALNTKWIFNHLTCHILDESEKRWWGMYVKSYTMCLWSQVNRILLIIFFASWWQRWSRVNSGPLTPVHSTLLTCSHPMYCWQENILSFDFECPAISGISVKIC